MKGEGKSPRAPRSGDVGRRDFLRILGTGGVAAGAGVLATGSAHADSETEDEKRKARYRETEHVRTFYRVNRYPGKG
jgi:hypothetical protein